MLLPPRQVRVKSALQTFANRGYSLPKTAQSERLVSVKEPHSSPSLKRSRARVRLQVAICHPFQYFWRVNATGEPLRNYPQKIVHFWRALPSNLTHVDAVYERPADGNIVFFIGE